MAASNGENTLSNNNEIFYDKAKEYWSTVDPTVNGMLGGFGCISHADIAGSKSFINKILKNNKNLPRHRALDCGAGIGRVTLHLLSNYFEKIDLIEQDPQFAEEAIRILSGQKFYGKVFITGLQDFKPEPNPTYDVIWCQWVLGHLTDEHLIEFFKRCTDILTPNGLIFIKENINTTSKISITDETDSSVTRPLHVYHSLFKAANLKIIKECTQNNFPRGLFSVKLFALQCN